MDKLKLRFSGFQNGDFLSVLSRHSINSVTFSVTKISPPLDICVFRTVLRITRGKIGYMDTMFKFITPITAWGEGEGKDSYQNIDARALETGTEFLLQVHIRTVRSRGGGVTDY